MMVVTRDGLEDWLRDALERRLGAVVAARVAALDKLDPGTFGALSAELAQSVYHCKDMDSFRDSVALEDSDAPDTERDLSAFHEVVLSEGAARARAPSRALAGECPSADVSPRNDSARESFTVEKRGRGASQSLSAGAGARLQAVEVLLRVPVGDIVGSANWPQLQQELCESLRDDNWAMFMQVLRVLARLSSSVAFSHVREGFLSLLEGLTLYYLTRQLHQQLPSAIHGIQLSNTVHRRIILISQCLLQVLGQVPGKWIRYGEKRAQELVDNFVDLLSMHTHHHRALNSDQQGKDILYPFHIFSVLDPQAKWCEGVMHAAFGRSILLKSILKSTSLMRFIVEEVIIWFMCQMKLSDKATPIYELGNTGNINGNSINMTVFTHCVSLLQMFIDSDRGYLMFPVLTSIQEEPVSVYSLLLKFVGFLNKAANEPKIVYSGKLLKVLENVCSSLILSRGTRTLHGSSVELINLLLEVPNRAEHVSLHTHNINILDKISKSPPAIRWMLGRPVRRAREGISRALSDFRLSLSSASCSASSSGRESALTNRTVCIARRIAKATAAAIRDGNRFVASYAEATSPLCQLLRLSEKLFSTPEGYNVLESVEAQLVPLAGHLLMHIRNMMYNSDEELLCIQRSLESFLVGVTLTPMGFLSVSGVEGLVKCLVASYVESPVTTRYEEPRFLHLLHLSTSIPHIKLHNHRKVLVKYALNKLWAACDAESEWVWQEAKCQFLSLILSICATPAVVCEMLDDLGQEDSVSESTLVEEIEPLSFRELLARGLQHTREASHIHEISFHLLHVLAHNIEIGFVLEEKLNVKECLQKLLLDNKIKDSSNELTIDPSPRKERLVNTVDECTHSFNHVLVIMTQLRDTSSCDIVAPLRSPRTPRTHAHTSRPRVQTELQRFLQDTRHGLHDNMWMSHARRAYRASSRTELKVPVLLDLLDQILQSQPQLFPPDTPMRWPTNADFTSYPQQHFRAVDMVIRYGCQAKALNANMVNQHVEQLTLLLCQTQSLLGHQNTEKGFDWFTSSVFLMCAGNIDRSRSVLQRIAMLPTGPFLWPLLSQNTMQLTASVNQQLQSLLAEFVPKAYNVLLEAGVPWWLVSERLNRQSFLPILPLPQLPHVIALTALHSWEYSLYMKTAILAHVQPSLLEISLHGSVLALLSELKMDNFIIGDYLPFMDKLAKLNRPHLVRDRISTATL